MSATTSNQSTMPIGPHLNILTEKIAIDCEMMQSNIGQVLGRVSVVNYEGETVYDTFVCYPSPITIKDTYEDYSGIDWRDIDPQNGAQLFPEVQTQLVELLRGRIVIGHDIDKHLDAISMDLPSSSMNLPSIMDLPSSTVLRIQPVALRPTPFTMAIRATQKYRGYRQYVRPGAFNTQGPNLKDLALAVLGRRIKQGDVSSVKGAVATMEVIQHAEMDIDREQEK